MDRLTLPSISCSSCSSSCTPSCTPSTWFTTQRIQATVTRQFARLHLLPDELDQLDKPLAFGDGLTDCTYWEWIQSKASRLFLVLVDLDLADQIFGVVDDSWEDDDLPVALDQVERLSLTATPDPRVERKFFRRQFHYLLRPLSRGAHVDYQDHEVVPLDVHEKKATSLAAAAAAAQAYQHHGDADRVGLPDQPGWVFSRRRFAVGPEADADACMTHEAFMGEVDAVRGLQSPHAVSYWASYTHQGYGYVLFAPASEYRLAAYLAGTPPSVRGLDKLVRRRMVLDWVHCLAGTLCFLHGRGVALGNVKPSTVFFTHANHLFLSPPNRLHSEDAVGAQGNSFDKETYDYAAPEQRSRTTKHAPVAIRPRPPVPGSRGSTIPSSRSRSHTSEHKLAPPSPKTPPQQRPSSSSSSSHHHSDHASSSSSAAATSHSAAVDLQAADIFSAGCIILELLGAGLLKRSSSSFASHRGARHKNAGRGGAVLDSSFHKNLGQVETWMGALARDADKKAAKEKKSCGGGGGGGGANKDAGARLYRGVTPILHVVERMLSPHPPSRPSALEVQRTIYQILTEVSGLPGTHCPPTHQHNAGALGPRDSGSVGNGGGAMATIDETAISPTTTTTTSPTGFGYGSHHHDYAYDHDDDPSARRSNSLRSFIGLAHSRGPSEESIRSKSSSSNQSYGERRDVASGLMQNLRISKSWQANPPLERDIASRHSR